MDNQVFHTAPERGALRCDRLSGESFTNDFGLWHIARFGGTGDFCEKRVRDLDGESLHPGDGNTVMAEWQYRRAKRMTNDK